MPSPSELARVDEEEPQYVTITVRIEDAYAIALGPLDYAMKSNAGRVPKGGRPMRIRQTLADALDQHAVYDPL